jgi:hypothetical protein
MKPLSWLPATLLAVGALSCAAPAGAATGTLSRGTGDGIVLTVRNTHQAPLQTVTFTLGSSAYTPSAPSPSPPCAVHAPDAEGPASVSCGSQLEGLGVPPGGSFTVTFTVAPRYPDGSCGTLSWTTNDAQGGSSRLCGPGSPAPAVSLLRLDPTTFVAAARGGSVAALRPVGTRVSYRLSAAAAVTFRVEKRLPGRRVAGRCVVPTRSNRGRPACTRHVPLAGSFRHAGGRGTNRFGFTGRLRGRSLPPGPYRLVAMPAGGSAARAGFRILP